MKRKNLNAKERRRIRRNFIKFAQAMRDAAPQRRTVFSTNLPMTRAAWDRIRKIQELGTVSATPV